MLRISVIVAELKKAWKTANGGIAGRVLVVDVKNVSVISSEGENAFLELMSEGAKFRCSGVITRYLIQQLKRRSKSNSNGAGPPLNGHVRHGQGHK
jgi:hypothetical protein